MNWLERISFENQMKKVNPHNDPIHYVGKSRILLSELMDKAGFHIDNNSINEAYVIIEDWNEKLWHKIESIANYSPQDDMLEVDEKGCWNAKGSGLNVTVHLKYKEGDSNGYLTIHNRWHGIMGADAVFYNHVTFFHNRPDTNETELKQLKYSMDVQDQKDLFDNLYMKRLEAEEKRQSNKKLTPDESQLLDMPEHPQLVLQRAKSKMEEHRWGDAIADLFPVYRMLKHFIMTDSIDKQWVNVFSDVCLCIATCYYHKGLHVKAISYLRYINNEILTKKADELMEAIKDDGIPPIHQFSFILQTYFDIMPSELSTMIWIDDKTMETGSIDKQREIWEYDMKEVMRGRDSLSLYISYRSRRSKLDDEFIDVEDIQQRKEKNPNLNEEFLRSVTIACKDRSICEVDSVIIVHLSKKDGVITMSAMLPGFNLVSQYEPRTLTLNFADSELVSHEECSVIHDRTLKKMQNNEQLNDQDKIALVNNQDAVWNYCNGWAAFDKHYWGDAIYYLSKTFKCMFNTWYRDEINENEEQMMMELDYKLGFVYTDQYMYDYALFYLERFYNFPPCRYKIEYINCLVNSCDLYAWNIVNNELKKLATDKNFLKDDKDSRHNYEFFLQRRMGHILIDKQKYAQAKQCFEALLDDPESRPYALRELQYINMLEKNNG